MESTATVDVRSSTGLLEGDGILTDIGPPDVVQGAKVKISMRNGESRETCSPSTLAVDTFGLRCADDYVGKSGAVLENEHSILLTSFSLALANRG